jgi:hypothetical protein
MSLGVGIWLSLPSPAPDDSSLQRHEQFHALYKHRHLHHHLVFSSKSGTLLGGIVHICVPFPNYMSL